MKRKVYHGSLTTMKALGLYVSTLSDLIDYYDPETNEKDPFVFLREIKEKFLVQLEHTEKEIWKSGQGR